jgi:hypothetical protein
MRNRLFPTAGSDGASLTVTRRRHVLSDMRKTFIFSFSGGHAVHVRIWVLSRKSYEALVADDRDEWLVSRWGPWYVTGQAELFLGRV